ncbi:hypothetical protein [Symbiopectobacterium purcellii]|uniref:Uncharacterized protein n=1 Tax=Symbiopectobacterium purcellii TaxID=2871826 RepID=A0ABX9ARY0_9ENTR|nr:hypothetical protein [Symbiopectobacterium purcellii]QZN97793.1 hypothetical protein K6K13_11100 [Symbiopectobacterium purcellii]
MADVRAFPISNEERMKRLIISMFKAGDYTTPRFNFHYHFAIGTGVVVLYSVEIASIMNE